MDVDLSLPEPPGKKGGKKLAVATFVLVGAVLVLVVLKSPGRAGREGEGPALFGPEIAETLEKRTLYGEAAALWEEIAVRGDASATALFRAGRARMLAGEPARAVRNFLAAEAAGLPDDLAAESSRHVLECYALLGKFAVRDAELKERTGAAPDDKGDVVARVGEEEITRAELNLAVRDEEAMRLAAAGKLSAEALDQAVAARMADPARLAETVSRLVSRRVLALEALARGLSDKPDFHRRMGEIRREMLANLLIEERLYQEMTVSEGDLRDHFAAHPERYVEPAAVRFTWGAPGDPPASLEEVEGWHEKGDPYPDGIGRSAEADAALFALEAGEVTRSVSVGQRVVMLRLIEKRPKRPLTFEEAKDRVTRDLAQRKRMEAVRALRAEVEARHPVLIVDEEIGKAMKERSAE